MLNRATASAARPSTLPCASDSSPVQLTSTCRPAADTKKIRIRPILKRSLSSNSRYGSRAPTAARAQPIATTTHDDDRLLGITDGSGTESSAASVRTSASVLGTEQSCRSDHQQHDDRNGEEGLLAARRGVLVADVPLGEAD